MRSLVKSIVTSSPLSFIPILVFTVLIAAFAGLSSFNADKANKAVAKTKDYYYRLQLKNSGQYLDADHCGPNVAMNPGSNYDGGSCELWRLVAASDGYFRLQLKNNNQYLDADHCGPRVALNPGSDYDGGSCELWRLVYVADGYFRLQLKNNGQYLDADHCGPKVALNAGSDYDGGSCQLWRLVPE